MAKILKSKLEIDEVPVGSCIDLEISIPGKPEIPRHDVKFIKTADDEVHIYQGADLFDQGIYEVKYSGDVIISSLNRFKKKYERQGTIRMDTYIHKKN